MTVCIAALADCGKSLALVCDSMISLDGLTGDRAAFKICPLTTPAQWWAMIAGDVSHVVPIVEAASANLLNLTDAANTRETVERAVVSAYQKVRRQLVEDAILSPLGLEWNADNCLKLADRIDDVTLGCELLIAGFDWNGDGYLFTVEDPGVVNNQNVCGYYAIGSGSYSALATMMHHSVNQEMSLARILYHACEAKFMAESAEGVGRHTHVKVARAGGKMDANELQAGAIDSIRRAWEEEGKPRIPHNLVEQLEKQLTGAQPRKHLR